MVYYVVALGNEYTRKTWSLPKGWTEEDGVAAVEGKGYAQRLEATELMKGRERRWNTGYFSVPKYPIYPFQVIWATRSKSQTKLFGSSHEEVHPIQWLISSAVDKIGTVEHTVSLASKKNIRAILDITKGQLIILKK